MKQTNLCNIWQTGRMLRLSWQEKLMFLYFVTNPHSPKCGIFTLTFDLICYQTGLDPITARNSIDRLMADKIIFYSYPHSIAFLIDTKKNTPEKITKIVNFIDKLEFNEEVNIWHFSKWLFTRDRKPNKESYNEFIKLNKTLRLSETDYKEWKKMRDTILIRDDYTCFYCKKRGGQLEIDHKTPFSRGGKDTIDNLVASCKSCNRSKFNKTVDEYLIWRENQNG